MFRILFGILIAIGSAFGAVQASQQSGPYTGQPMAGVTISVSSPKSVASQAVDCSYIIGMTGDGKHVNGGEVFTLPFVLTQVSSPNTMYYSIDGGKIPGAGNIWLFKGMDEACAKGQAGNNKLLPLNPIIVTTEVQSVTVDKTTVQTTATPVATIDENGGIQNPGESAVNLDGASCVYMEFTVHDKATDKDVKIGGAEGIYSFDANKSLTVKNAVIIGVMKRADGSNDFSTTQVYFQTFKWGQYGGHAWVLMSPLTMNDTTVHTLNGVCQWEHDAELVAKNAGRPYHMTDNGIVWEEATETPTPQIESSASLVDAQTGAQVGG